MRDLICQPLADIEDSNIPTIQHQGNHIDDDGDDCSMHAIVDVAFVWHAVKNATSCAMSILKPRMPNYTISHEDYKIDSLRVPSWLYSFNMVSHDNWIYARYKINSHSCTAEQMPKSKSYVMKILTRDNVQLVFPRRSNPMVICKWHRNRIIGASYQID